MNPTQIKQAYLDQLFLSGPSEYLVAMTLIQLAAVTGPDPKKPGPFVSLFGPYKIPTGLASDEQQRWADYERMDWSIRQLPAINVFEAATAEAKDSDQAFLRGNIQFQVFWPPNFRRPDSRRVEVAFKGALQNFFASQYVTAMLDELYYVQRPVKVYGLNEYGKTMNWTPNTQAIVENEVVPVTIMDANYRIDLRSWYRALEYMGRTKENPFAVTLAPLTVVGGIKSGYDGVDDTGATQVVIPDEIAVNNP